MITKIILIVLCIIILLVVIPAIVAWFTAELYVKYYENHKKK